MGILNVHRGGCQSHGTHEHKMISMMKTEYYGYETEPRMRETRLEMGAYEAEVRARKART